MLYVVDKIRSKNKKYVCGFNLARHWLIALLGVVVLVLIFINFFWVHNPGKKSEEFGKLYRLFVHF